MSCAKYNLKVKKNLRHHLRNPRYLRELFFLAMIFISFSAKSQQSNVPLNYEWLQESEATAVKCKGFFLSAALMKYEVDSALRAAFPLPTDTSKFRMINGINLEGYASFPLHSSMRPWIEDGHPLRKNVCLQNSINEKKLLHLESRFPVDMINYHSKSNLLHVEREPQNGEPVFRLYVDPLLNLQMMWASKDAAGKNFYINTRGVTAHGDIGTKLSFETSFWENQAFFPEYIAAFAKEMKVIPGQGRWKNFKTSGYDYAMSSGYLSYSPCPFFNVQIGNGKFFVGDGYRSLLLSDNSFSYPFARFTGWFGRKKQVQYTTIYASLMNLASNAPVPLGTERLYQKKAAQFQQLSINIGRKMEISFFQGLIWEAADNRNKQCIRLAYVNPIMFASIPAYGLNDRNNFLLGGTFRVDVLKMLRLYGQVVIDEFGKQGTIGNKKGFQLGIKYFNVLNVKHFNVQLEYNSVNPYTYSARDSAQAYTHYNQPLAHPLGANFTEVVLSVQYKIGDFFLHARYSSAELGADNDMLNFGQNVFESNLISPTKSLPLVFNLGNGVKTKITYFDASLGYMISYATNLNVCVGITSRNLTQGATILPTNFVYVAVRTSLTNTYYDFFRK
jgi:hypothetical protein